MKPCFGYWTAIEKPNNESLWQTIQRAAMLRWLNKYASDRRSRKDWDLFRNKMPSANLVVIIPTIITLKQLHMTLSLVLKLCTKTRWVNGRWSSHRNQASFINFNSSPIIIPLFSSPPSLRTHAQFYSPEGLDARGEITANSVACQHTPLS